MGFIFHAEYVVYFFRTDPVFVSSGYGVQISAKTLRDILGGQYGDILRKILVEIPEKVRRLQRGLRLELTVWARAWTPGPGRDPA